MQHQSEEPAVFHPYTAVPTRHTPTGSPCPPLPARRRMLSPNSFLAPAWQGTAGPAAAPTGSHGPCAHQNWMLGLQQFPQSSAWGSSPAARPWPRASGRDSRSSPAAAALLSCPAAQPGSHGLPGTRGMLAGPGQLKIARSRVPHQCSLGPVLCQARASEMH